MKQLTAESPGIAAATIMEADGPAPEAASNTMRPRGKGWPKLHLIYFVLAMFDLMAIGGGLYLSHSLSTVFEESSIKNDEWSQRFVSIWKLSDVALALSGPGSDIFQSKDVAKERQRLVEAAGSLDAAIAQVRNEIAANVPPAMASHPLKTLTYIDQAMATMGPINGTPNATGQG